MTSKYLKNYKKFHRENGSEKSRQIPESKVSPASLEQTGTLQPSLKENPVSKQKESLSPSVPEPTPIIQPPTQTSAVQDPIEAPIFTGLSPIDLTSLMIRSVNAND